MDINVELLKWFTNFWLKYSEIGVDICADTADTTTITLNQQFAYEWHNPFIRISNP